MRRRSTRQRTSWRIRKPAWTYSLQRLEESRRQIGRSLVEVSAARNRLESQRLGLAAIIQKTQEQAPSAVKAGRDDLALAALERKQEAESRQVELETHIANLDRQLESLKHSQATLDHKIALFQAKKEELKAVYDSSRAQLQVQEAITGISADLADVGSTIQRAENRIREVQSRADAIEGLVAEGVFVDLLEPGSDNIDRELSRISRSQAIEDELARLKAGTGAKALPEFPSEPTREAGDLDNPESQL